MIEKPVIPGRRPTPRPNRWQSVGLVLLGFLIIAVSIVMLLNRQQTEAIANPLEPLHTVGEDVMVGTIRWKVLSAQNLGDRMEAEFVDPAQTAGQFIKITVEIENLGNESESLFGVELIDRRARKFAGYGEQYYFIPNNQSCALETLNPNLTKTCTFIFEVPKDVERLRLRATDLSIVDPELKLIDLGLG